MRFGFSSDTLGGFDPTQSELLSHEQCLKYRLRFFGNAVLGGRVTAGIAVYHLIGVGGGAAAAAVVVGRVLQTLTHVRTDWRQWQQVMIAAGRRVLLLLQLLLLQRMHSAVVGRRLRRQQLLLLLLVMVLR